MKPKQKTPNLELKLINDTQWSLHKQEAESFTLLIFYRGLHCPVCKKQLESVKNHLKDLTDRGIHVIGISMDNETRAKEAGEKWDIDELPIGYELSKDQAKEWGLYFSKGISEKEPELFSEPGMFLVNPDGTLYFSSVQTMPFARAAIEDIIKAVDFIKDKNYPARGEA